MEFRDLKGQYQTLKPQIDDAVLNTLSNGIFIGGNPVHELEEKLAEYVGVKHCITCANGTDALQLALMAWGIGPGDAVFVPDFTFFSSGEVVAAVGSTPVFVDVRADTFNIDPVRLSEAIQYVDESTELHPRVVIAVDLFGLPADYSSIKKLCADHRLLLLEDGAQGFGGRIGTKKACSFGDISTTSFFPAKPLGCYGDGGAIFTDDDEWAALIRSYAVHGKGTMKYDNIRVGMNSRLDSMQAAILQVKLAAFAEKELEAVDNAAKMYDNMLSSRAEGRFILPQIPSGFLSSWAQYTIRLSNEVDRDKIQAQLRESGIPTMVYYSKPMHEQLAFTDKHVLPPSGCLETEDLCKVVLSLPIGPYITKADIEAVSTSLMRCF